MQTQYHSAEVVALSKHLECAHCEAIFAGSLSKARKVKYEQRRVYCSTACRNAATRKRQCKPIPDRGPCPTCKQMFKSRQVKKYCSLKCYTSSKEFKETSRKALELANAANVIRSKDVKKIIAKGVSEADAVAIDEDEFKIESFTRQELVFSMRDSM